MFSYRCPSCGKEHVLPEQPAQDLSSKCLRCQSTILVPGKGAAAGGAAAGGAAASGASPTPDRSAIRKARTGEASASGSRAAAAGAAAGSDGMVLAGSGTDSEDEYDASSFTGALEDLDADDDFADDEDRIALHKGPLGKGARKGAAKKPGRKKRKVEEAELADDDVSLSPLGSDEKEDLDSEEEDTPKTYRDPVEKEDNKQQKKKAKPKGGKPWWQRWQVMAGIGAVLLIGAAVGGFLVFRNKTPKKPTQQARRPTEPKVASRPTTPKPPRPDPQPEKPVPVAEKKPDYFLSVARLSAELEADPEGADARYKKHLLEVSGLFDHVDNKPGGPPPKPGTPPSVVPELLFASSPVHCQLPTDYRNTTAGRALGQGRPATVRGTYQGKGFLSGCVLIPTTPPADAVYRRKLIEVKGFVSDVTSVSAQNESPQVTLEGPTDSVLSLRCYFEKKYDADVSKLKAGTLVILAGTCNGRQQNPYEPGGFLRLDNCQFVYTSAPTPPTPRLEAGALLRDYEEDLRSTLAPLPDATDKVEATLTVAQLNQAMAADPKAPEKYLNKVISVSGLLAKKETNQGALLLASGQTDHPLKVRCVFSREAFSHVEDEPEYRVRGLVTGLERGQLRLDNCTLHDLEKGRVPRLTADFLPHTQGKSLTYDVAMYAYLPGKSKRRQALVTRQVHVQGPNSMTEVWVTHQGPLPPAVKSLLDGSDSSSWVSQKKTKQVRERIGIYQQRLSGTFVQIGHPVPAKEQGKMDMVWEPVLKLRAKAGEVWTWEQPEGPQHKYTLERFTDYHGQPAVVIQETVTIGVQAAQEIRHVYVRDVGEVEQQHSVQTPSGEGQVTGEKKLVSDGQRPRRDDKKPAGQGAGKAGQDRAGSKVVRAQALLDAYAELFNDSAEKIAQVADDKTAQACAKRLQENTEKVRTLADEVKALGQLTVAESRQVKSKGAEDAATKFTTANKKLQSVLEGKKLSADATRAVGRALLEFGNANSDLSKVMASTVPGQK